MSLTSYRAAPPRASVNPFGIYRVRVNRLGLPVLPEQNPIGFCSCKGRTIIDQVRRSFILYVQTGKSKRPLARPDVFGWAEVS